MSQQCILTYEEERLIAHRRKSDGAEQTLLKHLQESSQFAKEFAAKIGLSEIGRILGLLHDFGKASDIYQAYLRSQEGLINPDEDGYVDARRGEIDHSTAGAQLVYKKLSNSNEQKLILMQVLALVLASHHSGLIDTLKPDGKNNFLRRMTKVENDTHFLEAKRKLPQIEKELDNLLFLAPEKKLLQKMIMMKEGENESQASLSFKHGLLLRFLLSCLLDADRLSSADFETPKNKTIRNYGNYLCWSVLIDRLERKFSEFDQKTASMDKNSRAYEISQIRAQVAQACRDFAYKSKGIYRLTVPTGGGKTLASLRFALHHAQAHTNDKEKIERIFYIVPYITIIDQNAGEVREILEKKKERDKVVLEHHSNLTPEKENYRNSLLSEDWDAPIIFTTQVQFLEALFGAGTRNARRMHQLANSVIIFDEVQTIPIRITHLFTTALRFLVHDCGSTVLLCTATQPPFEATGNPYRDLNIKPEQHIIQDEQALYKNAKRVDVYDKRKPGGWTYPEIADLAAQSLHEKGSVLIVMNTRASALSLYREIKMRKLAKTYQLSTNMCPAHRMDVLNKIRAKLDAQEPVICVSTQLIEAGVNIDFSAVIRSLAGLDSIAQSAGRCNRHGLHQRLGSVWIVNPAEENINSLQDIKIGQEKTQTILDDYNDNPDEFERDIIGLRSLAAYYKLYYSQRQDELDYKVGINTPVGRDDDLFNLLSTNTISLAEYQRKTQSNIKLAFRQSFQSAAQTFQVIDSASRGVIVPYKIGQTLITEICATTELKKQLKLLKRAQRYSISLFINEFDSLINQGAIHEVQKNSGIYYLAKEYYSNETGWSENPVELPQVYCK
jgi:CRISPR-associated endonuclease/helicase Cas3